MYVQSRIIDEAKIGAKANIRQASLFDTRSGDDPSLRSLKPAGLALPLEEGKKDRLCMRRLGYFFAIEPSGQTNKQGCVRVGDLNSSPSSIADITNSSLPPFQVRPSIRPTARIIKMASVTEQTCSAVMLRVLFILVTQPMLLLGGGGGGRIAQATGE